MKKLSHFKLLLVAPALLCASCGYGLKEVYQGVPYNSPDYFENYYNVWPDAINPNGNKNKITVTKDERELNETSDLVFTSTDDANFKECEPQYDQYSYTYDLVEPEDGTHAYGPAVAMGNLDRSFKYGVASKMFDGQMFCNGYFQNSRTQVEPLNQGEEKGFGVLFSKECSNASNTYFMMNFKCSLVTRENQNISATIKSNLMLHIGLYLRNDIGYTYESFTYNVNDVPTNSGDDHSFPPFAARKNMYVCFGFSLANIDTNRLVGFSLQYEKVSDTYSDSHPELETFHSIMLYEVSFPRTTWH